MRKLLSIWKEFNLQDSEIGVWFLFVANPTNSRVCLWEIRQVYGKKSSVRINTEAWSKISKQWCLLLKVIPLSGLGLLWVCVLEFGSAKKMYLVCIQPAINFKIQMAKGHVNSVLFVKNVYCAIFFQACLWIYWDIRQHLEAKMIKLKRLSGSSHIIGIYLRLFIFSASSSRDVAFRGHNVC